MSNEEQISTTTTDETLALIALNTIPYLPPTPYHRLIETFGSAVTLFSAPEGDIAQIDGVSATQAAKIKSMDPEKVALKELELADRVGAAVMTYLDPLYPEQMIDLVAPPPVLSVIGELDDIRDQFAIGIVGTRQPTPYGRAVTEKLTKELVEAGATIVSGLARGVDGLAHRVTIGCGGRTIAALGNGLNVTYPSEHRSLQKKIGESGGAVISQFPFMQGPDKTTFPIRNRLISGLSCGVLIVEAGEKSGSKITAYAALQDNREVFAVPGPINATESMGTNGLIRKGHAKLIQSVDDILDEFPPELWQKGRQGTLAMNAATIATLSAEEKMILDAIQGEAPHIDLIAQSAGLPAQNVSAILLSLELKGMVKQAPGKLFVKV